MHRCSRSRWVAILGHRTRRYATEAGYRCTPRFGGAAAVTARYSSHDDKMSSRWSSRSASSGTRSVSSGRTPGCRQVCPFAGGVPPGHTVRSPGRRAHNHRRASTDRGHRPAGSDLRKLDTAIRVASLDVGFPNISLLTPHLHRAPQHRARTLRAPARQALDPARSPDSRTRQQSPARARTIRGDSRPSRGHRRASSSAT